MAAEDRTDRRRLIGRAFRYFVVSLAALTALFFLAAWIGSSLPRNSDWREPESGITIMVETNGIHTGIVMPVTSGVIDWRSVFPSAGQPTPSGELPTHIAVGWGEREVFLNVPTWADLSPLTVLRILTAGGEPIMRIAHYVRPAPSTWHRPVRLRPEEYRRLTSDILRQLPGLAEGAERRDYPSFEPGAKNYDSLGRYTILNTCNSWVGDRLAAAGMRIGRWTPLAGGVMKWVPEPTGG